MELRVFNKPLFGVNDTRDTASDIFIISPSVMEARADHSIIDWLEIEYRLIDTEF